MPDNMLPWLLITREAKSVYQVYARLCYCSSPPGELLRFLLTPFKEVINVVRISCQPRGFVIEFPVIGFTASDPHHIVEKYWKSTGLSVFYLEISQSKI